MKKISRISASEIWQPYNDVMMMQLLQGKGRTGGKFRMIFMYDDTDFCLEIATITRVMVIKAKGSANYGPPCREQILQFSLVSG